MARNAGRFSTSFIHAVIGDLVGRCLGAQDQVVTDILLDEAVTVVLLDEAVTVVAANDRLGRCVSSISVCSLPRYCLLILRPR